MKRDGGVSVVPCIVNGLPLSFIFDTGASDVTISITEARFMLKNGYLSTDDILGSAKYSNANGEISEGIVINLKEIEFAGLRLYNVRTSIVTNSNAPLLLGQSAIRKLGPFILDLDRNSLTIFNTTNDFDFSNSNIANENHNEFKGSNDKRNLFDKYIDHYNNALKFYEKKMVEKALVSFIKALEVHDYMIANNIQASNGFKFSVLDTMLVLYTAIAANEAKKPDKAAFYHKKLVDAGLIGDSYADSYNFLVDYYKKKNKAAFYEVLNKAKKFYPTNARYWTALEVEVETEGIQIPELFKKFDELVTANPGNYDVAYNYAAELFNYINSDDPKGVNLSEYKANLKDILRKSIAIKSTFEANFIMTVFQYNNSFDLTDEANKMQSLKPEVHKRKKALQAESMQALTEATPYGEAAAVAFKNIVDPSYAEKGNYRKLLTMLRNIYEVKKNTAKAAEYDAMIKTAL